MKHIFREYDIRGIYEKEITPTFAKALGEILGKIMLKKGAKSVSVGYDARYSNEILNNALIYGLNQNDIKVYSLGLVPTPLGYFSNFIKDIDANIMITASHNPKEYNGFKITIKKESFFADELASIYEEVKACMPKYTNDTEKINCENLDIKTLYVDFIKQNFSHLKNLQTPICIDTAGGAACEVAQLVLDSLGIKYAIFFDKFDSNFSAHEPDPTHEENLFALKDELGFSNFNLKDDEKLNPIYKNGYIKNSAQIGFGFDGDADRVVCVIKDKVIKGDELCYLFAACINEPKILCEVKCSKVIFDEINNIGKCFMGKTGHSNIKKSIKELNVDLAAELSGHVFFNDRYFGYDDAIYAMLRIIEIYSKIDFKKTLSNLKQAYSSDEIKIPINEELKFKTIQDFKTMIKNQNLKANIIEIDGLRLDFDDGFLLLRASNTSPYLIARFESTSKENLSKYENIVKSTLKQLKVDY